jgi:hypothetical protein
VLCHRRRFGVSILGRVQPFGVGPMTPEFPVSSRQGFQESWHNPLFSGPQAVPPQA